MKIEAFFKTYQDAVWSKNTELMINLYHTEAVIFDMWDKGYILSATEWAAIIKDWLGSLGEEKVKVEFEMITIHQSGNAGFASALVKYQAISKEGTVVRSMKNRITLGFSKFEDEWKVIHQHTSAPVSSKGLTAILDI